MKAIDPRQTNEPIVSPNEVGSKPGGEMGAFAGQIGQRAQLIFASRLPSDGNGVSVLKSQWRQPVHVVRVCESPRDVAEDCTCVGCNRIGQAVVKDRDESGTGVFGIDVDRTVAQGFESDLRGAKARPPLDAKTA